MTPNRCQVGLQRGPLSAGETGPTRVQWGDAATGHSHLAIVRQTKIPRLQETTEGTFLRKRGRSMQNLSSWRPPTVASFWAYLLLRPPAACHASVTALSMKCTSLLLHGAQANVRKCRLHMLGSITDNLMGYPQAAHRGPWFCLSSIRDLRWAAVAVRYPRGRWWDQLALSRARVAGQNRSHLKNWTNWDAQRNL